MYAQCRKSACVLRVCVCTHECVCHTRTYVYTHVRTPRYPLLLIEMQTQQLPKTAAVVVSRGFGVAKGLEYKAVAHDSVLRIRSVGFEKH